MISTMSRLASKAHHLLAVLALVLVALAATPAFAQQQPTSVNPTAQSVREDELLRALQGAPMAGRVSIPDAKAATLQQPAGRQWSQFHQQTMHWIGGIAIIGMLALIAVFYMVRGKIKIDAGPSATRILRFNAFERFVHWITALCFVILAITGLNITFGKVVLLPVIGPEGFTAFSLLGKYAHNYLAFPFMAGLVFMFLVWVKDNIPGPTDVRWFAAGGGLIGHGHPPAKKFNGGQKMIFWSVILGGAALSLSGVYLLFPYLYGQGQGGQQFWNMIHGIVGMVLIAFMIAHIYIGSVGMQGAFDAMGSGEVDLNWAKEHHSLWVEAEMKKGTLNPHPAHAVPAE